MIVSTVKAVVLRTPNLSTTKAFFEKELGFKIKESSSRHFVLSKKGIRLVFMETDQDFHLEMEMYVDSNKQNLEQNLSLNGIKIIVLNSPE